MPNQIYKDLVAAKELIKNPRAWLQLSLNKNPQGSYCLGNAIYIGCEFVLARQKSVLYHLGFPSLQSIWDWNDNSNRTHADVMVLLDEGIERAANL